MVKTGTASGLDEISTYMIKNFGTRTRAWMLDLMNNILYHSQGLEDSQSCGTLNYMITGIAIAPSPSCTLVQIERTPNLDKVII